MDGLDVGRRAASLNDLPFDEQNGRTIDLSALERLELRLETGEGCAATYEGYLSSGGELRPLPVGSSLDRSGIFYWYPGPAFRGVYSLIFVRTGCDGTRERVPVTVRISR